jgi:hypothetical protein
MLLPPIPASTALLSVFAEVFPYHNGFEYSRQGNSLAEAGCSEGHCKEKPSEAVFGEKENPEVS